MPYCLIASIINLSLSLLFIYLSNKEKEILNKKISYLECFSSIISSLDRGMSFKNSYEISNKYLISYHEILPLDDFLNQTSFYYLDEYQNNMIDILNDEKNNQVHLSNYFLLTKRVENKITEYKSKNKNIDSLYNILSGFILLIFLLLLVLRFTIYLNTSYPSLIYDISFLSFSLVYPLLNMSKYLTRRNLNARKN